MTSKTKTSKLALIAEIFRPSLKCIRIGHRPNQARYSIFTTRGKDNFGYFGGVADDAVLSREECGRCGAILDEGTISDRSSIHSLSMPSDDMRILKRDKIFIRRKL